MINCEETDEEGVKSEITSIYSFLLSLTLNLNKLFDLGEADCIVVGSDESIDGNSEDGDEEECFFYDENEVMCLGSKEDMMMMSSTS